MKPISKKVYVAQGNWKCPVFSEFELGWQRWPFALSPKTNERNQPFNLRSTAFDTPYCAQWYSISHNQLKYGSTQSLFVATCLSGSWNKTHLLKRANYIWSIWLQRTNTSMQSRDTVSRLHSEWNPYAQSPKALSEAEQIPGFRFTAR